MSLQSKTEKSPKDILKALNRIGCPENKIRNRQSYWIDPKSGAQPTAKIEARMAFFRKQTASIFEQYASVQNSTQKMPPDELFHVTCTGYSAPSAAQICVGRNGWQTRVTHFYHMGCYAALAAVRSLRVGSVTDIVHTELCTLHFDPNDLSTEQIVIKSLFGDGVIFYRHQPMAPKGRSLNLRCSHECILEEGQGAMSWDLGGQNFMMKLGREVPALIEKHISNFVSELLSAQEVAQKNCLFAIHPGGPAIIEAVASGLDLEPWQYTHSVEILAQYGNMSSATLPYVWASLLDEAEIRAGTPVVSLAFGPGLTLIGNVATVHVC